MWFSYPFIDSRCIVLTGVDSVYTVHALVLLSPCILHSNDLFFYLFLFFLTYTQTALLPP